MTEIRWAIGVLVVGALMTIVTACLAIDANVLLVCEAMALSPQECADLQRLEDQSPPGSLCEAIVTGNADRATQLVKQGADVNAGDGCALIAAAHRGQLELVKLLLEHKADPNRHVPGNLTLYMGGPTPLHEAVVSRKVQMVQILLEGGANPRNDLDAFQVVLNFGDVEMAELLLRHGANANMTYPVKGDVTVYQPVSERESRGITVPRRDLEPDRIDDTLKRFQCRISEGESLLYSAVRSGSPGTGDGRDRIAKLLIDHGADPNARALNGSTPLMMAASQHNHRVMTMLMDAGADVKATDRCGRTAEDYAVLYSQHQRSKLAPQTKALLQDRQRK